MTDLRICDFLHPTTNETKIDPFTFHLSEDQSLGLELIGTL